MRTARTHNTALTTALGVVLWLQLGAAAAQESWLDKARDFLGTEEAEEIIEPGLSEDDIASGLQEALKVGTRRVVDQLGATDGFAGDPEIRIPLPDTLERVRSALHAAGMAGMLDDLELRLNRAAEIATPKARELFIGAINEMTLDDVMGIYEGPDDAATRYFESKMRDPLALEMHPVVEESLADAGAAKLYGQVMEQYNSLPFVAPVDADLSHYVVRKGMDGIFHYLAKEEAAIREDPAARTTDLLKKVFGQ